MGCSGGSGLGACVDGMGGWLMAVMEGPAFLSFLLCEARREGVPVRLTKECLSVPSASFLIVTDVAGCLLEYHDEYASTAILSAFQFKSHRRSSGNFWHMSV